MILVEAEKEMTVTELIAALERVDNKDIPVRVWWGGDTQGFRITDLEYDTEISKDAPIVWIDVEEEE